MKITTKLWVWIIVLIVISPLGLILPEYFKAGSAWGEWGIEEIQKVAGYIPQGFGKLSELWISPIPDYAFKRWDEKGFSHLSFAYIISAIIGIAAVAVVMLVIGRILAKKGD